MMQAKSLEKIIEKMKDVVEKSKEEIFQISEQTMKEHEALQEELAKTKILVKEFIKKHDDLEKKVRLSRQKLSKVSREFEKYTEEDIRKVYEETHYLQMELEIVRREEKLLRQKRDDLERRIIQLSQTLERANNLGRKVSVILTFLQDDFHQMSEVLKTAKEKQELGLKIMEAQEQERKRISREIHDGPAQSLANLLVQSEIIDLSFRDGNLEQAMAEVAKIRENIRETLREVRRIIYDLRPMALDDLGLIPTIKKHVSTISEYHDTEIELKILGNEYRLRPDYEVAIFRLIQEGLQNAIKHANASVIKVLIELLDEKIAIIIKDDGVGFDPAKVSEKSFGLLGMKERVEILNGKMKIDSKIGSGTKVTIVVPYNIDDK